MPGDTRAVPADRCEGQVRLEALREAEHPGCLLCRAEHPLGLGLDFRVQPDDSVVATFVYGAALQSYPETLHGGVICAVLDAAMTNALFAVGVVAVTAELTVRFLSPVTLDRPTAVRARVERSTAHGLYYLKAEIEQDRQLRARAAAKFVAKG